MSAAITMALMLIGAAFIFVAGVGVVRMPDVYMRMSATSKAATLGVGSIAAGAAVHFDDVAVTSRVVAIIAFVLLTAPVAAHMIGRAAYFAGVPLWSGTVRDELRDRHGRDAGGAGEPPRPDEEETT